MHAIGLCETFLSNNSKDLFTLENYQSVHQCRSNKSGGGVSLLIHNSIRITKHLSCPNSEAFESVAVVIKFLGSEICISEFYRPPNTQKELFNANFEEFLLLVSQSSTSIVCSDRNFDLSKLSSHKPTEEFLDTLLEKQFIPTILKPTRITHRSSTLIVKSKVFNDNYSYVLVDGMSDHYPCLLSYMMKRLHVAKDITIEKRKLNEETLPLIQQYLLKYDWSNVYNLDVNAGYEFLVSAITEALDKHAPKRTIILRSDEKFREPWLTIKLKKYNQKCHKLCNKARKKPVNYPTC